MKKLYLTGCFLVCCTAYSQNENPPQNETTAKKYAGAKVQQPDTSRLIYTTDKKLLRIRSQTPKLPEASQFVHTPESARKKTGPILPAVPVTAK